MTEPTKPTETQLPTEVETLFEEFLTTVFDGKDGFINHEEFTDDQKKLFQWFYSAGFGRAKGFVHVKTYQALDGKIEGLFNGGWV